MNDNILVSVHIVTYNQIQYIRQAIDSVLNQKVSFNYEIIIGDDHSNDGTTEILQEYAAKYPQKIRLLINEKNYGFIYNWINVFKHCKGKYIAILEGDDFWTDEYKLQKQVDFLETNPDYGLVCSDYDRLYIPSQKVIKNFCQTMWGGLPSGYIHDKLIAPQNVLIQFLTTVFRRDLVEKYFDFNLAIERKWKTIDVALWIVLSKYSKVKYFPESMAVYRVLKTSISNSSNAFNKYIFNLKTYDIYFYFAEKYQVDNKIKSIIKENYYKVFLSMSFLLVRKKMAIYCMSKVNKDSLTIKEKIKYYLTLCPVLNKIALLISKYYINLKYIL
jgi:glycosyltransferase involved in cell wall biosynthesis